VGSVGFVSHPDQVGLVLDTTAVLGFAMRRMGVREPIEQVADSDQDFGVREFLRGPDRFGGRQGRGQPA
jgi:hypothetical protein